MEKERTWGITPVPERLRTLSGLDVGLLWGNLGISLLVLVAGTLLAGLGLRDALLAILVGAVLGNSLLGLAGLIGADRRVPGMVLMRDPLGRRGSYLPTGLNVLQNLGWATFELIVIAAAANALADELFGFRERWVWVLVFAALTTALALAGPISFVRRYVRRFAVWAVAASVGYLTWWALDDADAGALWSAPGEGGLTWWQGVDLTVAMAASWLPLAADYTRFARSRRGAFWGTSVGYFVPHAWLFGLGALLFLSRGLDDTTALLTAVAAGGAASALALLALTVDETDEPFANVYSAAVSLQNLLPQASQRLLILLVAGVATGGALGIDLARYEAFLFLLGSFFVPLFGVLAADFLVGAAQETAVRWSGIGAWLAGFALYQWIQPTGPERWVDFVAGAPGVGEFTGGASLPAFALAFALYAALRSAHAPLGRRRARLAGSR
ncbi:MAG TPA: cytosine permease [Gaiellaceae bacterium]|jgi:putative hydroxymethylpyrimidine transporter CytX|nr:cytosine permease [Gaiellaceae bacterium]